MRGRALLITPAVIVMLLIMLTGNNLSRATDVSGDVWGVWESDGNPYQVIGNTRVPPESTLLIQPGVFVQFIGAYEILVDSAATLRAEGSPSDSVFLRNGRGITFNLSNDNSALRYCLIRGMVRDFYAPIRILNCDVMIEHCMLDTNWSYDGGMAYGGAIYCSNSSPLIRSNWFDRNSAIGFIGAWPWSVGGAIYLDHSNATIERNVLTHNRALGFRGFGGGGAIFCSHSNPVLINNTITGNTAWNTDDHGGQYYYGSGIYLADSSQVTMINSIAWGNTVSQLYAAGSSSYVISYCDIGGTVPPGEGNFNADPMFVDSVAGNCSLQAGSPCVDSGDPASPLDPDTTRADIGALPFDHRVSLDDLSSVPIRFGLLQNYPNPFNASTIIRYDLPEESEVSIGIFDVTGRRIDTFNCGKQTRGHHSVIWGAGGRSSGVYFYTISAGKYVDSRRCLLLK